jgi:hypothetical protein
MVALIACNLITAACYSSSAAPLAQTHTRVLFVGNSLTYYNDLPRTFAAIAASTGDTIDVAMIAAPNLALIDHLEGGSNVVERLKEKWDFVVLQQGPTTEPIGKDSLIIWTKLFDTHIRAAGAVPVLFMVWPMYARWERMALVRDSYVSAARSVDGLFAPAGDAWAAAHTEDASLRLYGADDFHPAPLGTYLAALTIYATISGKDPRTIRVDMNLPESDIRLLQRAAHSAISQSPAQ